MMKRRYVIALLGGAALAVAASTVRAQDEPTPDPSPAPTPAVAETPTPTPTPTPPSTEIPAPTPPAAPEPTQTSIEGLEPVTTPSGLTYYDIKVGEGETPRSGALVELHYSGWLTDGTLFDSSVQRGEPFKLRTNGGVIEGWVEGLATMKVGGKRRLEIPAALAYGERGRGKKIPPNSNLIFEIELLSIIEPGLAQTPVDGIEPVIAESGLKCWDIKEGAGEMVGEAGRVRMDFSAWLKSGRLLGSSYAGNRSFVGRITEIPVPGWVEGVKTMKAGGKRRLEIPSELAYGEKGTPGVPPNAVMVVEVDIVEVLKPIPQSSIEGIEPVVTESGLKYWDIKVGDGEMPRETSGCRVHYTGWLMDGTLFSTTRENDEPFLFGFESNVIEGWKEGVKTMKVGGIRRLEIPAALGYGAEGRQPSIPPDATLIFEIELIALE